MINAATSSKGEKMNMDGRVTTARCSPSVCTVVFESKRTILYVQE